MTKLLRELEAHLAKATPADREAIRGAALQIARGVATLRPRINLSGAAVVEALGSLSIAGMSAAKGGKGPTLFDRLREKAAAVGPYVSELVAAL